MFAWNFHLHDESLSSYMFLTKHIKLAVPVLDLSPIILGVIQHEISSDGKWQRFLAPGSPFFPTHTWFGQTNFLLDLPADGFRS